MKEILYYHTKSRSFFGTRYKNIRKQALSIFNEYNKNSHKRPYVRSKYFKGSKIFLDTFWKHISQKIIADRIRRLKFLKCAIELLKESTLKPEVFYNKEDRRSIYYRFYGFSRDEKTFIVQVKEYRKRSERLLISIFPYK